MSVEPPARPFSHLRLLDCSTGISGAYCAKLFADAGADVIKLEPSEGDPFRRWSVGGAEPDPIEGGALFRFLHHGTRSVIAEPGDAIFEALLEGTDLLIESAPASVFDHLELRRRHSGLVWLSITPFGRTGPFAERPSSEFIIQAESGGLLCRGAPDAVPIMAGGRISEFVAATFAGVAAAAALRRAELTGQGDHIDVSIAEAMTIAGGNYAELLYQLQGCPPITSPSRRFETPSIEPTSDGYVGFTTNSRAQFDSFLLLIERPDLLGDDELALQRGRQENWREWNELVHAWTLQHETEEIVKLATELRIPVAPVQNGASVLEVDHFKARGIFVADPTGEFMMPRRPWRMDDQDPEPPRPSPRLGEHTGHIEAHELTRSSPAAEALGLPLEGLRVLDMTAWWAGPVAAGTLAALGADVIHIESTGRPDGMRMTGGISGMHGAWWERSAHYLAANANKRGLTLDLETDEGLDLLRRLIEESDAVIENFTPRVMDNFGLTWEVIHKINPACVLVRMPAFGLSGPWRDSTGFAQTMEQVTGLAWLTGMPSDQPRIQRGPSDPNAGMHAAFALLAGIAERARRGEGMLLEVTMVEGALNAAAEIALEYSAYGNLLERDGNRVAVAAPQGLYACQGVEEWLAVSVTSDEAWHGLRQALGEPSWAADPRFDTLAGRRDAHDELDEALTVWAAQGTAAELAAHLSAHGVPAARGRDPRLSGENPQLIDRGFYEIVNHAEVGELSTPTMPFRFDSVPRWIRRPAPQMGEHNREIFGELLGLDDAALEELEHKDVIGRRPRGA